MTSFIDKPIVQVEENESYFRKYVFPFLFVVLGLIMTSALYAGDSTLSSEFERTLLKVIVLGLLVVCFFVVLLSFNRYEKKYFIVLAIPIIYWIYTFLNSYSDTNLKINTVLALCIFALTTTSDKINTYKAFRTVMVFLAFFGCVCYICYLFNIPLPHDKAVYYINDTTYYLDYKLCYINDKISYGRLCGTFNEPGYYGTILGLLLCTERFNLKKLGNWFLLIAGFFTFSLGFVLTISIYLILLTIKKPKLFFPLLIIFILVISFIYNYHFSNEHIQTFVDRFKFEDSGLAGDNRTTEKFDYFFEKAFVGNKVFFGYGDGYAQAMIPGNSSYKVGLLNYGYIGFVLLFGLYVFAGFKLSKNNFYSIILTICFAINIYQRPSIFYLIYFIILFGGIENLKKETDLKVFNFKKVS